MPYLHADTMNPKHWLCVIHACRNPAIACCVSRHGHHAFCADHNFEAHGNARPYRTPGTYLQPEAVTATAPRTRPDIGPQPPVRPITPPKAPTPTSGARVEPVPALASLDF